MVASAMRGVFFCVAVLVSIPPSNGKELAALRYDVWDDVITVPVRVVGEACWFVVDTGSSGTFIDASLRHKLGPVLGTRMVNGNVPVALYASPLFEIGEFAIRSDQAIGCASLESFHGPGIKQVRGVIGMDLLREFILQLDPDHTTISLLKAGTTPQTDWGTELEIDLDESQRPTIEARVNNDNVIKFVIDLGDANTADLALAEVDKLIARDQDSLKSIGLVARARLTTTVQEIAVRATSFTVGPYVHANLVFIQSDGSRLGLHYLRRYKATFDFPRRTLYLKPSKHFFEYDYSHDGLMVFSQEDERRGHKLGVFDKSPAARAGIRNYDLLLEVDGLATNTMAGTKLMRYFQLMVTHDISLLIQRGEQKMRFRLPRGKRIGRINEAVNQEQQ
ncbi:MAG: aspartyl protease family protein [Planctomycetes bacterium]|nr:aspartyl protease family protein [Planctomycetota bacterium]